jgi:putative DNA primase/helicase
MGNNKVDHILGLLNNVRPSGDQWSALCPAHGDTNNSLSVGDGDDGRVLLYCHAGCSIDDIVDALDLTLADLFPGSPRRSRVPYGRGRNL